MFEVDQKIKNESIFLSELNLCQVYLKPDSQVTWLILVPKIQNVSEIQELEKHKRLELMEEINFVSNKLKENENFDKINIGSLGNIVSQLHIHIIGRNKNDRAWPNAIWGVKDHQAVTNSNQNKWIEIFQDTKTKKKKYEELLITSKAVLDSKNNYLSNMANLCTLINEKFNHHWVGIYLNDSVNNKLTLGPYVGPLACTEISYGKGVCGTSFNQNKVLIVDNVHDFPGHIACSSHSNSEIVLPFKINESITGVLYQFSLIP